MAKRLSDIALRIDQSGDAFGEHIRRSLSPALYTSLVALSHVTEVYIFSGVIRNFFLKIEGYRDVDIVLREEIDIQCYFNNADIKRNSFGGYKIHFQDTVIDLWFMNNTWAFTYQSELDFKCKFGPDLKELIPGTAFFNFSAIIYSFNERKFYASNRFRQFLRDKEIDLVFEPNANFRLCVINTFYYEDRLGLRVADRMKRHIIALHRDLQSGYGPVQQKHFGAILYSDEDVEKRIVEYSTALSVTKRRRKQTRIAKRSPKSHL